MSTESFKAKIREMILQEEAERGLHIPVVEMTIIALSFDSSIALMNGVFDLNIRLPIGRPKA